MKPQISIRQLRYFLAIARAGSLTAASRTLYVAQPALSRHLKAIENEFGVKLFRRIGNGVELTDAGNVLLEHAEAALNQIMLAYEKLGRRLSVSGEIRLAMTPSISFILDREIRRAFKRVFPHIELKIFENMSGPAEDWLNWIKRGLLDVAVLFDIQTDLKVQSVPILEEDMYLVGGSNIMRKFGDTVKLRNISNVPIILPGQHLKLRKTIDAAARKIGTTLNVTLDEDSLSWIVTRLIRDNEASILGWSAVGGNLAHGELVASLILPKITRVASIVSYSGFPLWAPVMTLITELSSQLIATGSWRARLVEVAP